MDRDPAEAGEDVLTVAPMTPLVEVAQAMIGRRVSSPLVTEGDVLVGIDPGKCPRRDRRRLSA